MNNRLEVDKENLRRHCFYSSSAPIRLSHDAMARVGGRHLGQEGVAPLRHWARPRPSFNPRPLTFGQRLYQYGRRQDEAAARVAVPEVRADDALEMDDLLSEGLALEYHLKDLLGRM